MAIKNPSRKYPGLFRVPYDANNYGVVVADPFRSPPIDVLAIDARPEAGDITIARSPRAQKKDPPK